MDKVAIVTDSNSGITLDEAKRLGIRVVPMPFLIDGKTYYEEISCHRKNFLNVLRKMLIYQLRSLHRVQLLIYGMKN